ncbi:S-glutathionyl-(chloro)hydroquinone reductase [Tilletia horrida]|nr:S-glutathionyl-(chloro)hydroquinone reductase [Tilletia horrida]
MSTSATTQKDDSHKDGSTKWSSNDGVFRRQVSSFRDVIAKGHDRFQPEAGRYHLIVALACPWACRTLIVRQLKGFDQVKDLLPVTIVDSYLGPEGWTFVPYGDDVTGGALNVRGTGATVPGHENKKRVKEFYLAADPGYEARATVPIVWDNKLNTIVSNESSEIIRFFNDAFNEFLPKDKADLDFYPENLRKEIDELNEWVYPSINNGVYRSGFASKQAPYEEAVKELFQALDRVEKILADGRDYLVGGKLTEADIRLFTTIVRFDPVYYTHFKTNIRDIRSGYPHINRWLRNLYWKNPAFKDTTDFDSIKAHYFASHKQINGHQIVPKQAKMTSPITCHVLDSSAGLPAPGVRVQLFLLDVPAGSASLSSAGGAQAASTAEIQAATAGSSSAGAASAGEREAGVQPRLLAHGETNNDGRCTTLLEPGTALIGGATYRMRFETGAYFRAKGVDAFYPYVEIPFTLSEPPAKHYHIPLLLAPFSYTTYRGS